MKIEIKPIDRKRWHGKSGKESFARPHKIKALVDANSMEYATGLNYIDKKFPGENGEKLTEAEHYAKILNQDLSNNYNPEQEHSFWDSKMATISLENHTFFLDTSKPLEYLKVKICRASKYVANSLKEYEDGYWPDATHFIHDESEEMEMIASGAELRNRATIEASELSTDKKRQIILILDGKNLKGKKDGHVIVALEKLIQERPREVLKHIKMDTEDLYIHAVVLEALQKSVLRRDGHKIMYHDSVIGGDEYDVIEYLKKEENDNLKLRIISNIT